MISYDNYISGLLYVCEQFYEEDVIGVTNYYILYEIMK